MTQQVLGGDNRTPGKTIGQVKFAHGQTPTHDGRRAQPADKARAQQSQQEGPAAYAPHEDATDASASNNHATNKKG